MNMIEDSKNLQYLLTSNSQINLISYRINPYIYGNLYQAFTN